MVRGLDLFRERFRNFEGAFILKFLGRFAEDSEDWPAILDAIKTTFGGTIRPAALRSAIQTYFRLAAAAVGKTGRQ